MSELKFSMTESKLDFGIEEQALSFGLETVNALGGDYVVLSNKPKINGVVLVGDRSSSEIHVQDEMDEITEQDIDKILYGG